MASMQVRIVGRFLTLGTLSAADRPRKSAAAEIRLKVIAEAPETDPEVGSDPNTEPDSDPVP